MLERNIGASIFLVVQHGVTVRERTAANVLTGHANRVTFELQGCVCHGFGITPVDRQAAGLHFLTVFVDLRHLTLHHEAFWNFQQLGGQFLQGFQIKTSVVASSPGVTQVWAPVYEQLFVRFLDQTFHNMQAVVQRVAVFVDLGLNAFCVDHFLLRQALGIQFTGSALLGDLLIHQWLSTVWLVGLVVTATAVAEQVDHDVTLELHAVVDSQLGHEQYGFRIITIDMEDRRLNHFRDVSAVLGRTGVFRIADGEADLVVDHQVNRTASLEAASLRHLEGFHDHALTCEGSITVDGNWQYLFAGAVVTTVLASAYRPFNHWRNDFQVGRVKRHCQVNFTTGSHDVGGEALVVFNVTGTQLDLFLAFELVEQLARVFAEGVHQYVQATTVGHADNDFLGAVVARTLDQLVQQRNQAFAAFQAETLGARVFGPQVLFQTFSSSHALKQMAFDFSRVRRAAAYAFEALFKPVALLGIDDVRELCANGAAICLLQRFENFA